MNDMKYSFELEAAEPHEDGRDVEEYINRTPYSAIDYALPRERTYEMVKA